MKIIKYLLFTVLFTTLLSCFNDDMDDHASTSTNINEFIWNGLNYAYLYNANVPDLADGMLSSLNTSVQPEVFFENLIYQRETVDRYSWITNDYIALQQLLSGTTINNGMEYNLYYEPNSSTNIYGVIRLVLPNSDASSKNLSRGMLFSTINGTELTIDNYRALLSETSYTIGLATYNDNNTPNDNSDDAVVSDGNSISLTKSAYTENPVHTVNIINTASKTVGYLLYNSFLSDSDSELNAAFQTLSNNAIDELVIDLRYNPGGSVNTATLLGSLVTGQFPNDVFAKLVFNSNLEANNSTYNFATTVNGSAIHSLNLNKVYVLTTKQSASASEMLINSLRSYIDVVQIGTTTEGKSQASITLYDSPTFEFENVNPNHTYAMQPLVAKTTNTNDESVPSSGLIPNIEVEESPQNYGVLGDENEPLLAAALTQITSSKAIQPTHTESRYFKTNTSNTIENNMYINHTHIDF